MDIEQTIRQSVEKAKQNGFTLVHQDWGSLSNKCACPMGCVILQAYPTNDILEDAPQASVVAATMEACGASSKISLVGSACRITQPIGQAHL